MNQEIQKGAAEYKVRAVTRYVVTRFKDDGRAASSTQFGEFDNQNTANAVAEALCFSEPNSILTLHGAGDPVAPTQQQVNSAGIIASDAPHVVVEKLRAAHQPAV